MNTGRCSRRTMILIGVLVSLLAASQVSAQQEETNILGLLQSALTTAIKTFNSQNQPEAILQLNQIIDICQENRASRELSEEEKKILAEAHDYRGRAFFNIGESEKAQADFEELVKLNPRYKLDENMVSPKIITLFDKVKNSMVGNLAIFSTPSGSEVSLNGKFLSLTPMYATELLRGDYTLEVKHKGYDVYTESLAIVPNTPLEKEINLVANTGTCVFLTSPPEVKVFIDDVLVGNTFGQAPPEMAALAERLEIPLQELSSPLKVEYVSPGTHRLELKKECFEPIVKSITVEIRVHEFEPMKMEPSKTSIRVNSVIPSANVYLDDAFKGITPLTLADVCTGEYILSVKKEKMGKWFQKVKLSRNEAATFETFMRPTLAYMGIINSAEKDSETLKRVNEKLTGTFANLASINFASPPPDKIAGLVKEIGVPFSALTGFTPQGESPLDPKKKESILGALGQKLDAELILFAYLPQEKLQRHVYFELYSTFHEKADVIKLAFTDSDSLKKFSATMDSQLKLFSNWIGLVTVDTFIHKGIVALKVMPDSPAQKAGIATGDILTKLNNEAITSNREFLSKLKSVNPGEEIKVSYTQQGIVKATGIKVMKTPVELLRNSSDIYYNRAIAELKLKISQEKDKDLAGIYRLNLGFCYMHYNNWQKAIEDALSTTTLGSGPGISAGTLNYYIALCYQNLGYLEEAKKFYGLAVASKESTLESNDGPSVEFMAQKKLNDFK